MIFVSYSQRDASIVAPLVDLLRISGPPVFRDKDSIPPGTKWRQEIDAALESSKIVFVFWCRHAADSKEVETEYLRAIELGKPIVPILLDSTRLSDTLARYQAIDFREALGAHEVGEPPVLRAGGIPGAVYLRQPSKNEFQAAAQYLITHLSAMTGPYLPASLATWGVISQDQPTEFGAPFGVYLETKLRRMKKHSTPAERIMYIHRQIAEMDLEQDRDKMQIRHRMINYLCQEFFQGEDWLLTNEERDQMHDQIKNAEAEAQEKYLRLFRL